MPLFPIIATTLAGFLISCASTPSNGTVNAAGELATSENITDNEDASTAASENTASGDTLINQPELSAVMRSAELPEKMEKKIEAAVAKNSAFIADLRACLKAPKHLRELVNKQHPLPQNWAPNDLVLLKKGNYQLVRKEFLRKAAAESLNKMAAAARANGVTLTVSSGYRSYDYQVKIYNRNVANLGKKDADREAARPGFSQHQTGLAVDFYPVSDLFVKTTEGRWIAANASRFGWLISYPNGYEAATGYRFESWHYRYVGLELASFTNTYFDGIQEYALRFLYEWERALLQQRTQLKN
jgi:D-alanyl-D-alanine carboxypeptidase